RDPIHCRRSSGGAVDVNPKAFIVRAGPMVGTLMIDLVTTDRGSRFLGRLDELSILSGTGAIEGPLPVVRPLWSILTVRLLHVLTTESGTEPKVSRSARHWSVVGGRAEARLLFCPG